MNYVSNVINNLNEVCLYCKNHETDECVKSECNIGATLRFMGILTDDKKIRIPGGKDLIPTKDMKYYDERTIARSIASICKLCKQCEENHDESCTVSLARKSLESIFLKEMEEYPGNFFMYIVNVNNQNPGFADLIKEEFQQID